MGVNCVVYSKDRPMQLDGLLRSIEANASSFFDSIRVLFRANGEFEQGYDLVKIEHPNVFFVREQDFAEDTKLLLRGDFVCFLLDDDIIFRKILFKKDILALFFRAEVSCFSFRLGLNIDYCYSNDKPNTLSFHKKHDAFISWKWQNEKLDFGYPLSVTAHLFRTKDIKRWTDGLSFRNPNEYEGKLQTRLAEVQPVMISYNESRVVGLPVNLVNETTNNRHGLSRSYDVHDLNARFLLGQRIDIAKMDFSNIHAAQQELVYGFAT